MRTENSKDSQTRHSQTHNLQLLEKFKRRAVCRYLLNKTDLDKPKELAELFSPLNLGDSLIWEKRARGEKSLSNTISLIEKSHNMPFRIGGASAKFCQLSENDYRNLYKKVSNVRYVYEDGPEITENLYAPIWPVLAEHIEDMEILFKKLLNSISWPAEAIDYSLNSKKLYDEYIKDNPDTTLNTLPVEYHPISTPNACLCLRIKPDLSNWHKLSFLILLFRYSVEFERSELEDVIRNLGWTHPEGINDDAIGISYISAEDSQIELEDMLSFSTSLYLTPLNLTYLKKEITNQLVTMESELTEYGLSGHEIEFYLRQLYSNFYFEGLTLNQLRQFNTR